MSLDPTTLATLPLDAKREVLGGLLREVVERARTAPLSISQERLWLTEQLDQGTALYNIPVFVHAPPALDIERLRAALVELSRRHEILRTTFAVRDGAPVQVVGPAHDFDLQVIDLGGDDEPARQRELTRALEREAQTGFDLGAGPLMRARLLRLPAGAAVLSLVMHHIVSDGWSLGILLRELWLLYQQLAAGGRPALPPLPLQYADFARWQRGHLAGGTLEALRGWWRRRLEGAPLVLDLPTDHPRPPRESFAGAVQAFELDPARTRALRALARQAHATLFMVLLAAWKALLFRYTGQGDLIVGTPLAGRSHTRLEGLIGFFVNNVALRTPLADDPSFRALVARVRDTVLQAFEHQELPFDRLIEELADQRDPSRPPICQVVFNLQNAPTWDRRTVHAADASPWSLEAHSGTSKFELNLTIMEVGDRMVGAIEYKRLLFEPATIRRLIDLYLMLLDAVTRDPDRSLLAIDLGAPPRSAADDELEDEFDFEPREPR